MLVVVWASLGLVGALVFLGSAMALVRTCPPLADIALEARPSWPRLTVIVPACNEAESLEAALESLRADDYPCLEIVVVDDRSTDGTGAIVDRLSAADPRIIPLHVQTLPDGWLGKVHALDLGMARATGDFVLFTDADVHFATGTLRRAVLRAERESLDHLAVFATVVARSVVAGVCAATTTRSIVTLARPWQAIDPKSERAIGTGAFNLVRRSAFDKTPGLEWLRMEVAEDIGIGLMMKRSGGKPGIALGRGLLSVAGYASFGDVLRSLEKNAFAQAARFRAWRGLAIVALALVGSVAPFVGFLPGGVPCARVLSAAAVSAYVLACIVVSRAFGEGFGYALCSMPLGDLLMTYVILRAVWLGKRRGGLTWRGTTYATDALEAGQRVVF